jgi:hypothetical protein
MTLSELLNRKCQLKKSIVALKLQGIDATELERDLEDTEAQIRAV